MRKMREYGEVTEVCDGFVKVKIARKSACGGNCGECGGMCRQSEHIIEAVNVINAKKRDIVEIQMPAKRILGAAFLVYIIPLIMLAAGYYIAGNFIKSDVFCAFAGFIFMIISFFLLHKYDKRMCGKYKPAAVSLVNNPVNI